MQEPSDPGEVHHSEANQDQQGERAPPGVSAREDGVFGAGAVESVRKAELRAGTQGGKKYNPKVFFFFFNHLFFCQRVLVHHMMYVIIFPPSC